DRLDVRAPAPGPEPDPKPAIYQRARERWAPPSDGTIRRTDVNRFDTTEVVPATPATAVPAPPGRRVRVYARSAVPFMVETFEDRGGNETVSVISRGVTLIIDGVPNAGQIDISTDRAVIWRGTSTALDTSGQTIDDSNIPLEIYMEGNIDFRQG